MDRPNVPAWIVRLELQRIQTFLFAVPRLRAMVGANALLGDAIRATLPALSQAPECPPFTRQWPGAAPVADDRDPLAGSSADWTATDDPVEALKHGVLSRDGGHLRMAFGEREHAKVFVAKAREQLARTLPDLLIELDIVEAGSDDDARSPSPADRLAAPVDLPQWQVCTRSGDAPACERDREAYISAATKSKEESGRLFLDGQGGRRDYISLLRKHMPHGHLETPTDLDELSDAGGYLAVIHADGNRVGQRIKAYQNSLGELDWLAHECAVERFFHSMRSTVRGALISALHKVYNDDELGLHEVLPYQLLMLGGDDLLLVCHPRYALPFVRHYAAGLMDRNLVDGKPLSIGAGVIFAKHSLPFHRLHGLAESLAGSAKRAYLQYAPGEQKGPLRECSVVDWSVLTSSCGEDPLEHRRVHEMLIYGDGNDRVTLGLTAKPYFILDERAQLPEQRAPSLERLLNATKEIEAVAELPRSQLKDMLRRLGTSYEGARLAYLELLGQLPKNARDAIERAIGNDSPWTRVSGEKDPIRAFTQLKDLIECLELRYLGRRKQEPHHG